MKNPNTLPLNSTGNIRLVDRYIHESTLPEKIKQIFCRHSEVEVVTCEPVTYIAKTGICTKCNKRVKMKESWS